MDWTRQRGATLLTMRQDVDAGRGVQMVDREPKHSLLVGVDEGFSSPPGRWLDGPPQSCRWLDQAERHHDYRSRGVTS